MKSIAAFTIGLFLLLLGMYLMDVPKPQDDLQRWLWNPLGVAMMLWAGRLCFPKA